MAGEFTKLFSDPDLLSIVLGTIGEAIGEPGGWQQRLGKAATGLARGRKYAGAASAAEEERRDFMDRLFRLLEGGVTPAGEMGLEGLSLGPEGKATLKMTLPEGGELDPTLRMTSPEGGELSRVRRPRTSDIGTLMGSLLGPW